jgi:hypothetical protein
LSIAENAAAFERITAVFRKDPILRWQSIVCREFVKLRLVSDDDPERIPASFEFRSFWWHGQCVGLGPYWIATQRYAMNESERRGALAIAAEAAKRVDVPFLVVDLAQTVEGQWLVIECNDGQESGYAGVSPLGLWQNILTLLSCS